MCYNISVCQRATAGKERQTVYEYKKVLSRSTPTIFGGARHVVTNAYITITAGRDERPFAM